MKNKLKILILTCIFITFSLLAMSKKDIDYSEYDNYIKKIYKTNLLSYQSISDNFYDDTSCIRLLLYYYSDDKKEFIESDQLMIFSDADNEEIEQVDNILLSLGKCLDRKLTDSSIKNIYDIPVGDLYCLTYEAKFENYDNIIEEFWLKKREGKIYIYRYTTEIEIYR